MWIAFQSKSPQAITPWSAPMNASHFEPMCPQPIWPFLPPNTDKQNEDCLFMNIWTPLTASPKSNLPVMIFFHVCVKDIEIRA